MIRLILLSFILLFNINLSAITIYEAKLYGSNILICNDNETVRYWSLFEVDNRTRIFNNIRKRSYTLDDCKLFKCSPNPSRFTDCTFPDDRRIDNQTLKQP